MSLSTWGEAIVAAACGDSATMKWLLAGEDNDGRGMDLRTCRTSWADSDYVQRVRNIYVQPHQQLVEIALERDHFDIVRMLTEEPGPAENVAPPEPHRAVSSCGPQELAFAVREHVASSLGDGPLPGLPILRLQAGRATIRHLNVTSQDLWSLCIGNTSAS